MDRIQHFMSMRIRNQGYDDQEIYINVQLKKNQIF